MDNKSFNTNFSVISEPLVNSETYEVHHLMADQLYYDEIIKFYQLVDQMTRNNNDEVRPFLQMS